MLIAIASVAIVAAAAIAALGYVLVEAGEWMSKLGTEIDS